MEKKYYRILAGPKGSGQPIVNQKLIEYFRKEKIPYGCHVSHDDIQDQFVRCQKLNLAPFSIKTPVAESLRDFALKHQGHKLTQNCIQSIRDTPDNIDVDLPPCVNPEDFARLFAEFMDSLKREKLENITVDVDGCDHSSVNKLIHTKRIGYVNYLYFMCTQSPDVNKYRLAQKPEIPKSIVNNIEKVYHDSLQNLLAAVCEADVAYMIDTSDDKDPFPFFCKIFKDHETGEIIYRLPFEQRGYPNWFLDNVYYADIRLKKTDYGDID
jgi:hypothetical protein